MHADRRCYVLHSNNVSSFSQQGNLSTSKKTDYSSFIEARTIDYERAEFFLVPFSFFPPPAGPGCIEHKPFATTFFCNLVAIAKTRGAIAKTRILARNGPGAILIEPVLNPGAIVNLPQNRFLLAEDSLSEGFCGYSSRVQKLMKC